MLKVKMDLNLPRERIICMPRSQRGFESARHTERDT